MMFEERKKCLGNHFCIVCVLWLVGYGELAVEVTCHGNVDVFGDFIFREVCSVLTMRRRSWLEGGSDLYDYRCTWVITL